MAALWGSSAHLVSGPTTAISLVIFATVSPMAEPGSQEYISLILTISLLVGIIQLVMGWLKFGRLLNFISHTVVVGFTAGAAILIGSSQIKNFFGVKIPQGSSFYETIHEFLLHLDKINPYIVAVSSLTLIIGLILKKKFPKIPYMIPAMLVGSFFGYYLTSKYGFDTTAIKTVGALPSILPPFSFSLIKFGSIKELASPALAVTMLALVEAVAISKAIALKSGQQINGNQEIIGQGISNIVGSMFSAYPASGSFNRTGLNYESGAKTQFSSVYSAIFLSIIVLFVAPLAAYLPNAVMAAILFLVAYGLIDFHHIKNIIKANKSEASLLVITFLSTLFIELEFAIFVGVLLSIAIYLRNTAKPHVSCYVPDNNHPRRRMVASDELPKCPQLTLIKIDGSIFFGSTEHVEHSINRINEENPDHKIVLIVFSSVSTVDLAGFDMLSNIIKKYRKHDKDVYFSNVSPYIMTEMQKSGLMEVIGDKHICHSKPEAIAKIYSLLDKDICAKCTSKIFKECNS
ncbi:SulP family inorganic anion transporter, partial [Patescibacteria group bacterium]|nr:SulP family inorganic anion transporter [Patescibacteria group bacterium]